jgi:hypothetical protein
VSLARVLESDAILSERNESDEEVASVDIWESFVGGLENIIRKQGLVRVIGALSSIAAVLLGLGVVVDRETTFRFASFFVVALLFVTCIAFYLDRHRLQRDLNEAAEVLDRYGDEIFSRQNSDSFDIKEWREEQHIGKHGNTTLCRWFTLVVKTQELQTFWHRVHMTTRRQDFKYKKRFSVEARPFDGNFQLGARFPVTLTWQNHSASIFIHLDRAYSPGEEVPVYLQIYWPEYAMDLLDREIVDPTEWEFHRHIGRLQVTMSFDKKVKIEKDFRITPFQGTPSPRQTRGGDRNHRIEFLYESPPQKTPVGFRIERTL